MSPDRNKCDADLTTLRLNKDRLDYKGRYTAQDCACHPLQYKEIGIHLAKRFS